MPNYGVIDLGSNTIRLVIFEVKDDAKPAYAGGDFRSLLNDKVMAGLSAHVHDGVFSEGGVRRAASVVRGHLKRARYFNCKRIDVFATAVIRNALNCADACAAIEEATGAPLVLLSARDEAHLGFVGATCDRTVERGTLIDIGGGSTELTRIEDGCDFDHASVGMGSLSSYANQVASILPTAAEMESIAQALQAHIEALPHPEAYRTNRLYGIGGSVRAAAKLLAQASGTGIRPKTMTAAEIRAILEWCRTDPDSFAHCALKASAERIHTLVPGCAIASALMDGLGADVLEICKYGLREGYLIERMLGENRLR